jgi:hypothetical protein
MTKPMMFWLLGSVFDINKQHLYKEFYLVNCVVFYLIIRFL